MIGDIIAGEKDVVYTTFFGYDEVAHHCGVADDECFYVLKKIDERINRINCSKKIRQKTIPHYHSFRSWTNKWRYFQATLWLKLG